MDNLAQVRLVALVIIHPLRIHHVVQSHQATVLVHGTTANTSEFLHVSANSKQKTQVHTESSNVRSGLAANPEDTQVPLVVKLVELALVDGTDTELALDSGDQGRALEKSTGQGLQSASELGLAAGDLVMETDHANVFLSGSLLRFHEAGRAVDAHDQTSSDLGVEGTAVTGLLRPFRTRFSNLFAHI